MEKDKLRSENCKPEQHEAKAQSDLGAYCGLLSRSSIGSGWTYLAEVLAQIEARQSLPPRRPPTTVRIDEPDKNGTAEF